jgi:hypothetical protein
MVASRGKGKSIVTKGLPGRCERSLSSIQENVIHSDEENSHCHPSTRVSWLPTKGSPTEGGCVSFILHVFIYPSSLSSNLHPQPVVVVCPQQLRSRMPRP